MTSSFFFFFYVKYWQKSFGRERLLLFSIFKSWAGFCLFAKWQDKFVKALESIFTFFLKLPSVLQGVQNNEHFGFISRDADCYVGYVFKCESNSVADDVVSAITQSFHATKECKEYKQPVLSCEHCPMVWFHKLCAEIEGKFENVKPGEGFENNAFKLTKF